MTSQYDEDYFLRGRASGKSLYENYRWLPELTIPMARRIVQFCGISAGDRVVDWGCARGYLVRALIEVGVPNVTGYDISEWALKNCDPAVVGKVSNQIPEQCEFIILKDCAEHFSIYEFTAALERFKNCATKGVFIVVPLSSVIGEPYIVPEYEKDITHQIRWPLWRWVSECHSIFKAGWEISSRYRVEGIKDNYAGWMLGNGFISIRRVS